MKKNGRGGRVGNLGNRKLSDPEREARLEADRLLNLATPDAIRTLLGLMRGKDPVTGDPIPSTNMDKQHAAVALLDRKVPRITQAEHNLRNLTPRTLKIPGFDWPAPIKESEDYGDPEHDGVGPEDEHVNGGAGE